MPTENVLVQINSAANLSGFQALESALSMSNLKLLGLGVALGLVGEAAKSSIDNTLAMEKAQLTLQQAVATGGNHYQANLAIVENFIATNKRFIANQYDVVTAYAASLRAGNSAHDSLRILNDALDLSVIKSENVSDAQHAIELALMGNGRALKELGISASEYSAITKSKTLTDAQKHADILALIERKTKNGRDATDKLTQAQQALNDDWQNLSTKAGPPLVKLEGDLVEKAGEWYDALDKLGKDDALWAKISDRLTSLAGDARNLALYLGIAGTDKTYTADYDRRSSPAPTKKTPALLPKVGGRHNQGRAGGGPVMAGEAYTVGENGPEELVMGSESGTIMPNGSRGGVYIDLRGAFVPEGAALDRFINMIAQRISYTTGM